MKLIHASCVAVAASLLPTAMALEPSVAGQDPLKHARSYSIVVAADVAPVAHAGLDYPYAAASRGLSGSCSLSYDVNAGGAISDIQVTTCSSPLFRRMAARLAGKMTFAAPAAPIDNARMEIRWSMTDDKPIRTASLD
jgi:outer membrane biosynthesis protein TonB